MAAFSDLQLAVDFSLDQRDAAAQRLAQARQVWIAAQMQLDQLETYANETTTRWTQQLTSCTPELMRHHYQFMDRLMHAINLQRGIVGEHEATLSRLAQTLRHAEARLESLRQLKAERVREHQMVLDRRDQKQSDEMASQQYRRLSLARAAEAS